MTDPFKLLTAKEIRIFTGKALVGALNKDEQLKLCNHITTLEMKLDSLEAEGNFTRQGSWRDAFGMEEE